MSEQHQEKLYFYIADHDARHPLNDQVRQVRGRLLEKDGEILEVWERDTTAAQEKIKEITQTGEIHKILGTSPETTRYAVVFVEEPLHHPIVKSILQNEEETSNELETANNQTTNESDRLYLEQIRQEHHICTECLSQDVCIVTNNPVFEKQLVTVTSCLGYKEKFAEDELYGNSE